MAALINLKLMDELENQGMRYLGWVEGSCYGWNHPAEVHGENFIKCVKTYFQACNLKNSLSGLHQVCSDFVAGNFQLYMDEHNKCVDPDNPQPYDPFNELTRFFIDESAHPSVNRLPERIEQYTELLMMVSDHSESQRIFLKSADRQEYDVAIDPNEIANELTQIEVDYCLDKYDHFYWLCRDLIDAYQPTGDVQTCAAKILSMFTTPKS